MADEPFYQHVNSFETPPAAGSETDRLASYRVNSDTGALTPLETYPVGKRPMWVLMTKLGG